MVVFIAEDLHLVARGILKLEFELGYLITFAWAYLDKAVAEFAILAL
jgi:hypothetical protein